MFQSLQTIQSRRQHGLRFLGRVDDNVARFTAGSHCPITLVNPLVKGQCLAVQAIGLTPDQPLAPFRRRQQAQEGLIRLNTVQGQLIQLLDGFLTQAPAEALIGHRGVGETVAEDDDAGLESRLDLLPHQLCPTGHHQE